MTSAFGFGIALIISLVSMPLIIKVAHSRKLYDIIDDRKIHTGNIPRLGGLGIFLAFVASIVIITLVTGKGVETGNRFWVVIICMLVIHLVGLVDDFRNLPAVYKFIIELAAAVILSALGFRFMTIIPPFAGLTFGLGGWSYPITVIWIIGVTNAINLIDGMDGLAGGISAFAAAVYGVFFLVNGDGGAALSCFALVGAIFGFLAFNLPPAKVFMGDSGALFLGFTLSVLPLIGPVSGHIEIGFVSVVTVLIIPIFDTFSAIIRRMIDRVSVFAPDKSHLHHKLLELGLHVKGALAVIYSGQAFLCLVALSVFVLPIQYYLFLSVGTWVLYALLFCLLDRGVKRRESRVQTGAE